MKPVFLTTLTAFVMVCRSLAEDVLDFHRDIRPILSDACFPCHGPDPKARKAGLRLDRGDLVLQPAKSGQPAIIPGEPGRSELVRRILAEDPEQRMPPPDSHRSLAEAQKHRLQGWIREGAHYPSHWAFVAPRRPDLPPVRHPAWARTPVDRFILERLEQDGLAPAPEAPRATLMRRVTLDLTGLPPTPAQVEAFVNDTSPQAYERLVDRLLATRDYAERRAQDWLDLARYADTRGFADDKPHDIWPYRDWVIAALDRNLPFDQFTIEQLAGDLLPGATTEQRIASAFHRNAPQAKGATYPSEEYRLKGVVDRVNTTGTVWLGLTVGCAECHDHKFDPLSQVEYYRLFAYFNQIEHSGEGFAQGGPHLAWLPPELAARKADLVARTAELRAQLASREAQRSKGIAAGNVDADVVRWRKDIAQLLQAQTEIDRQAASVPVMQERTDPRDTFVHLRGNFLTPGERVTPGIPGFLSVPGVSPPRHRLEFARWLVSGQNPLVARVFVNRVWQGYFGHGLVRTPADFGLQGEGPTHPALLDWLATEFVDSGWDMKALNRLIVCSTTYRQGTRKPPELLTRDPQNRLLMCLPRLRLPAEQLRDQALAVGGLLRACRGGPSVFPPQPADYWEDRDLPGKWTTSPGEDRHRKSLYTYWRRMALHPSLELLDAPARAVCTARRNTANLPTQALVTLNDPIFVEAARAFADRLLQDAPSREDSRLQFAFHRALGRDPSAAELSRFLEFIVQDREQHRDVTDTWTAIATILMNLDEFLCRP